MTEDIYVTRPSLPPLEEFKGYLGRIWESGILSNCGPYHAELEAALVTRLGVNQVSLFTNGTIALVTALQALGIEGEVITTPFSFIATSHALLWNGITPVFVDIDPHTLNLDPALIEAAITPQTTAILAVHCYGHPADVDAIDAIGRKHGLKVIYDAAHAFGVECHCGSVLNHGDLSVLSFHATKVFNTFEGGAIVSPDPEMKAHIDRLKNFGHDGEISVIDTGINGKMSEINAAFGLVQLNHLDAALGKRAKIDAHYRRELADVQGIDCLADAGEEVSNYAYFPILVNEDFPLSRDDLYAHMKANGVHPRRYFYPLITDFPMYHAFRSSSGDELPVATSAARRVLCLPIYPDLDERSVSRIIALIANAG
jgi:dTDP-4-amino-4,6-dideoxygalactose transaminase